MPKHITKKLWHSVTKHYDASIHTYTYYIETASSSLTNYLHHGHHSQPHYHINIITITIISLWLSSSSPKTLLAVLLGLKFLCTSVIIIILHHLFYVNLYKMSVCCRTVFILSCLFVCFSIFKSIFTRYKQKCSPSILFTHNKRYFLS